MLVGLVSDSHGSTRAIDQMLVHPGAVGVELWFHMGDIVPDAEYLATVTGQRVEYVAGNCDYFDGVTSDEKVVELAGHRIFMAHGHTFGVRFTLGVLARTAHEAGADIALYGHTHVAVAEKSPEGVFVYNPGSVAQPRDHRYGSFVVMNLNEGREPEATLVRFTTD